MGSDFLVLSEDTTIEIDGKETTIKSGSFLYVDSDLTTYHIDEEFQAETNNGTILVESGDSIVLDGDFEATSNIEFVSSGNRFVIEKGDKFGVVEEGILDSIKDFFNNTKATKALVKVMDVLVELGEDIVEKAKDELEEKGYSREKIQKEKPDVGTKYDDLMKSNEFSAIKKLIKAKNAGMNAGRIIRRLSAQDQKYLIENADETIARIHDELVRIGDKELAKVAESAMSQDFISSVGRIWKKLGGRGLAQGSITPKQKVEEVIKAQQTDAPTPRVDDEKEYRRVVQLFKKVLGNGVKQGITDGGVNEKILFKFFEVYPDADTSMVYGALEELPRDVPNEDIMEHFMNANKSIGQNKAILKTAKELRVTPLQIKKAILWYKEQKEPKNLVSHSPGADEEKAPEEEIKPINTDKI